MTLASGSQLGPYIIEHLLGAGGMGEVYRARDSRLDRTVAIKILPDALGADPQFRDRFDREARTISQLDHPHICALYDVGEAPNPESHIPNPVPIRFLVMQYLEGETLADRLKKGALPINDALTIASQIADALDNAHRAGITHRDLKPGNVMLTRSGAARQGSPQAKLLDFGLARLAPVPSSGFRVSSPANSQLATRHPDLPLTAEGTILGTFQYMAPEQIEGHEADARTDIFAFGLVVYEMVTGQKAFEGKTHASLMAAILEREPRPIRVLRPALPHDLDWVVALCLAKNPGERWQHARDLRHALQRLAKGDAQRESASGGTSASQRWWLLAASLFLVAVIVGSAALLWARRTPAPHGSLRFIVTPPEGTEVMGDRRRHRPPSRPTARASFSPRSTQPARHVSTSGRSTRWRLDCWREPTRECFPSGHRTAASWPSLRRTGN